MKNIIAAIFFSMLAFPCHAASVSAQAPSAVLDTLIAGGAPGTCWAGDTLSYTAIACGATPPGGSTGQVQFNNAGTFDGLTDAQLTTHINPFSSTLAGSVPASGGGTTNFLRADGTFAPPSGSLTLPNYYLKEQYGAFCDGAHASADTTALVNAMAAMQTNSLARAGVLRITGGHCNFTQEMAWTEYAAQTLHSVYVVGDGPINTVLDFTGVGAGVNGISFDRGGHFGVSNLEIVGATGDCLYIGKGNSGGNYTLQGSLYNLRLQGCGGHGLHSTNSYEITASQIWSRDNTGNGVQFDGYHTSLNLSGITTDNNAIGQVYNGVAYLNLSGLASDSNSEQGYAFSNIAGGHVSGIGGEQNAKDMIRVYSSNASATGIPTGAQDVHGLVFTGLTGFLNSFGHSGTYASLMLLDSQNGRPIEVEVNGATGTPNTTSDHPFIYASTSGKITLKKQLVNVAQYTATDFYSLSGGGAADVSDPDGAEIPWTPAYGAGQFSANPTVTATLRRNGKQCTITYNCTTNGTSNGTGYTITNAPCIASGKSFGYVVGTNAGVQGTATIETTSGSQTLTITNGAKTGGGSWTASGGKCFLGTITYGAQ